MLKIRCIERQEAIAPELYFPLEYCRICEQGKKVREELITKKRRPQKGDGRRKLKCALYNDCLDHAAKKDWRNFNCDGCPLLDFKMEPTAIMDIKDKPQNTRLCVTEGCSKITLSPGNSHCASCMAKKAHEARVNKKGKAATDVNRLNRGHNDHSFSGAKEYKPSPEIVDPGGNMKPVAGGLPDHPSSNGNPAGFSNGNRLHNMSNLTPGTGIVDHGDRACLTISFGKYLPVLESIQELAEQELRPVDLQVIYMLKNQLKVIQEGTD